MCGVVTITASLYVPAAMRTRSPGRVASTAAWIVAYAACEAGMNGTWSPKSVVRRNSRTATGWLLIRADLSTPTRATSLSGTVISRR